MLMPMRFPRVAFTTALVVGACAAIAAQRPGPELLAGRWPAHWIRPADAPPKGFGVYHFRKTFDLAAAPQRFVIHATADNRYELFVNGQRLLTGPARGDLNHWRFESLDIAQALRAGPNVIAAVVWNFAEEAPMAQVTHETGLLVQGDTAAEAAVNTDRRWKAVRNDAVSLLLIDRPSIFHEYFVGGPGEQVDGERYPWGWESPEFSDTSWKTVSELTIGAPRGIRDTPSRWMLVPRSIPLMAEALERFDRIARANGAQPPSAVPPGAGAWLVAPHSTVTLLLDRGHLTTAYPEILTSGGRGASITLTYAEALREEAPGGKKGSKGNRNEIQGKVIAGLRDRFVADGGRARLFRPLWWRTFRYVEISVPPPTSRSPWTTSGRASRHIPSRSEGGSRAATPCCRRSGKSAGARPGSARTKPTWTRPTGNSSSTSATRGSRHCCRSTSVATTASRKTRSSCSTNRA